MCNNCIHKEVCKFKDTGTGCVFFKKEMPVIKIKSTDINQLSDTGQYIPMSEGNEGGTE